MKTCTNCGTEVHDEANFCNMCGGSEFFSPITEEPVFPDGMSEEIVFDEPAAQTPVSAAPGPADEEEEFVIPEPVSAAPVQEEPIRETPVPTPVFDATNYYTDAGLMPTPSRKHSKIVIAGVVALIAVILVIMVLASPQRRFINAIREGDSLTAGKIYYDSLADSENRKAKADARLSAYVDEQLNLYLNSEMSYEEFIAKLQAISASGIENESLPSALDRAEAVNLRRKTFEAAEAALAEGDYAAAIGLYTEVAEAGAENSDAAAARLEEAVALYRSTILEAVTAFIASDQFGDAYSLLKEALTILPGDAVLESTYADCTQAHHDHTIDAILAEVRSSCESDDYMNALAYLDSMIAEYPEEPRLQDERSSCLTGFEEYAFNEVYRLAAEEEFSQAADLAAMGLSVFESERVQQLHQICLSHIPVNLGDMEILSNDTVGGTWNTHTLKTDEYLEDRYGGSYAHSLSVGCGSLTYLVNYRYDTFTGVVAFPKGLTSNSAKKSATLTIYGDGIQLAVFKNFTSSSMPMAFDLDISSYEKITLKWECKGYNVWSDWGDFATIFDGVLTPIPLELSEGVG